MAVEFVSAATGTWSANQVIAVMRAADIPVRRADALAALKVFNAPGKRGAGRPKSDPENTALESDREPILIGSGIGSQDPKTIGSQAVSKSVPGHLGKLVPELVPGPPSPPLPPLPHTPTPPTPPRPRNPRELKLSVPQFPAVTEFGDLEPSVCLFLAHYASGNVTGRASEAKIVALRLGLADLLAEFGAEVFRSSLTAANVAGVGAVEYVRKCCKTKRSRDEKLVPEGPQSRFTFGAGNGRSNGTIPPVDRRVLR